MELVRYLSYPELAYVSKAEGPEIRPVKESIAEEQ